MLLLFIRSHNVLVSELLLIGIHHTLQSIVEVCYLKQMSEALMPRCAIFPAQ
jgi:hypothetical protein